MIFETVPVGFGLRMVLAGVAVLCAHRWSGWRRFVPLPHPDAALMRKVDEALLAGDHHGRDGLAAVFQTEVSMLDAPEFDPLDNLGGDEHGGAVVISGCSAAAVSYEGLQVVIARVRAGQLAEVWFRPQDREAFDQFFACSTSRSARRCQVAERVGSS